MREDFEYIPTMPIHVAQTKSNRKCKKAILSGATAAMAGAMMWLPAVILLGVLTVVNAVQKRRGD